VRFDLNDYPVPAAYVERTLVVRHRTKSASSTAHGRDRAWRS
jgi:hypothetical protein